MCRVKLNWFRSVNLSLNTQPLPPFFPSRCPQGLRKYCEVQSSHDHWVEGAPTAFRTFHCDVPEHLPLCCSRDACDPRHHPRTSPPEREPLVRSQGFSCNHSLFLGFPDLTLAGFFTPNASLTLSLFHPILRLGWFSSLQELLGLPLLRCLLSAVVQSSDFHIKVQIGQTLGGCSWTVLLMAERSLSPLRGIVATLDMLVQGQTPQGEALLFIRGGHL